MAVSDWGNWEISDKAFRLTLAICAVLIAFFCFLGVIMLHGTKVAEQRQACGAQWHSGFNGWDEMGDGVYKHLDCRRLLTGEKS